MLAPDGELLSHCDLKKSKWYVDRKLADIVSTDPFTIQFKFEPRGRERQRNQGDLYDSSFYLEDRENKCVCCGSHKDFSRYHVVPTMYREHFPD